MLHPPFPWTNPLQQPTPSPSTSALGAEVKDSSVRHDSYSTDNEEVQSELEEDVISLLEDGEAEQFREFDLEVKDPQRQELPPSVVNYLSKHFNKSLSEEDRKAILDDYLVPDCVAVKPPKLDAEVMEQLKSKGKDPQFGAERNLYKIQEQLLEATGPLTFLWVDLLRPDGKVSKEYIYSPTNPEGLCVSGRPEPICRQNFKNNRLQIWQE